MLLTLLGIVRVILLSHGISKIFTAGGSSGISILLVVRKVIELCLSANGYAQLIESYHDARLSWTDGLFQSGQG